MIAFHLDGSVSEMQGGKKRARRFIGKSVVYKDYGDMTIAYDGSSSEKNNLATMAARILGGNEVCGNACVYNNTL